MPKAGAGCSQGTVLATDTSMQEVTYATRQGCTKLLYFSRVFQYINNINHLHLLKTKRNYKIEAYITYLWAQQLNVF
jgi:hypothetical protein